MIFVSKADPSAKNRYIYYQDQINTLPSSLSSLLLNQPPVFKSVLKSIMKEPFVTSTAQEDESLFSFVSRRFNEHVALNLVGSITHGIYAGDAKQLSVKSTMRILYEAEKNSGSVVRGMFQRPSPLSPAEQIMVDELNDGGETTKQTSVFGFKEGTETLTASLKSYLKQQTNVTIITEKQVEKLEKNKNGNGMKVCVGIKRNTIAQAHYSYSFLDLCRRFLCQCRPCHFNITIQKIRRNITKTLTQLILQSISQCCSNQLCIR
jgi:oxygen-dependent protoporphyrinogen oxidase